MMRARFEDYFVDLASHQGVAELERCLAENGLVTFEMRSDRDVEVVELCESLGTLADHPDAGPLRLTDIVTRNVLSGGNLAGFSQSALKLHTDRAGVSLPPSVLLMTCVQPATDGGESIFLDGRELYLGLAKRNPKLLQTLLEPNSVLFGGGRDLYRSSVFSAVTPRRLGVRFRCDEHAFFCPKIALGLRELMLEMDRLSISIRLERNQGVALQNLRWLHGRTGFSGRRHIRRALIDVCAGSQIENGFDPGLNAPSLRRNTWDSHVIDHS
jgi:alpha-ketoglutarate-dependent taurine dioxygenase